MWRVWVICITPAACARRERLAILLCEPCAQHVLGAESSHLTSSDGTAVIDGGLWLVERNVFFEGPFLWGARLLRVHEGGPRLPFDEG